MEFSMFMYCWIMLSYKHCQDETLEFWNFLNSVYLNTIGLQFFYV